MNRLARLAPLALVPAACVPYAPDAGGVDPNVAVRGDVAQVCVVRPVPPSPVASTTYLLRDDGRLVGSTPGPSYLCWEARPGLHHVTSEAPPNAAAIDVTLVAGRRVFLRQSTRSGAMALDLLPEPEARAALADLRYASLVAPPGEALPPAVAVAADGAVAASASPSPAGVPSSPAIAPHRRPDGLAYGAAAGLGAGISRAASAKVPSAGFAALGSIWVGLSGFDVVVVGLRIDAGLVGRDGSGDVALHVAGFPGARSPGPVRDFMVFADAGVGGPLSLSSGVSFGAGGVGGLGRVGVAWERWRLRGTALGPFLAVEAGRAGGVTQSAALAGVGASLYSEARK